MRTLAKSQSESPRSLCLRPRCVLRARQISTISVSIAALLAAWLMPCATLGAQPAPAAAAPAVKTQKAATHRHIQHAAGASAKTTAQAEPVTVPAAPKPPDWPANDAPSPATVVWDSHGLQVTATNSSLKQILNEVSVDTGTKIEGFGQDERIFGSYGPGAPGDVISQLLDGSNYDVLIIGGQHGGTPQRVVLTARSNATPATNNANPNQPNDEDNGADEQAQQPEEYQPAPPPLPPRPNPNGFTPQTPGRTQQQLIEEMQERQRQLEQQRQQQNPQQ